MCCSYLLQRFAKLGIYSRLNLLLTIFNIKGVFNLGFSTFDFMSPLNTTNPIALQVLMSETIFGIDFPDTNIENNLSEADNSGVEVKRQDITIESLGENQKRIL